MNFHHHPSFRDSARLPFMEEPIDGTAPAAVNPESNLRRSACTRALGKTGLVVPPVIFGTSCLGNLYEVVADDEKLSIVSEIIKHSPAPVVFDSAGKYGAGLALEALGDSLRKLGVPPSQVIISNKLGWYRVPLRGPEPTFERGVWAGIQHDAESRISDEGILKCYQQGRALLGGAFHTDLVSVHDPDEFLAAAKTPEERKQRFANVLGAYRALFELKRSGVVKAVGVGAKDWRIIREIANNVPLDWVMFACSLTVYSHPEELLDFMAELHAGGVGMINSAVFNAGFLVGGEWFDYRKPDPVKDTLLFAWREKFLALCKKFDVKPADVCVQFGLAVPGLVSVALNTGHPERIKQNVASATNEIPSALWRSLKEAGLVAKHFPVGLD
jgi:D-threo-aldose 1-dehydrogenase